MKCIIKVKFYCFFLNVATGTREAYILFLLESDGLNERRGPCGRRLQVRETRPYTMLAHARALRWRERTQAAAKLQIYWSGNKYKYLIKKLLWKDLYTTVFCLDSATPALTPDPPHKVGEASQVVGGR